MKTFEEEWRARFERFGRSYEREELVSGWSENGLWTRFGKFTEFLQAQPKIGSLRVLDLGCGAGTYVRYLANAGHEVIGLDYSIPTLHRALAADPAKNSQYFCGEAYHLPFHDECFDLVISVGVIQALGNPGWALNEMVRVLRPNGYLIVEALNSLELVALGRRLWDWVSRRSSRLHTHSPYTVTSWLCSRGLRPLKKAGIYLPPKNIGWLNHFFPTKISSLIDYLPGFSIILAHSYLFFSVKEKAHYTPNRLGSVGK